MAADGKWDFIRGLKILTGYLNTKRSFQIGMFVLMTSGKCELNIYFTFLKEF